MKTKNIIRTNRISILFSSIALLLFPLISNAQLKVLSNGNVGMGISVPTRSLDVQGTNPIIQAAISSGTSAYAGVFMQDLAASKNLIQLMGGSARTGTLFGVAQAGAAQIYTNNAHLVIGTAQPWDVTLGTSSAARVTIKYNGYVGFGTVSPNATLHVSSSTGFLLNGPFAGSGTQTYVSDQEFKTNVDSIHPALNTIKQLKPRTFYFDTTNAYGLNFSNKKQYGLIAQDVEQVLPELVTTTTKPADIDTLGNIVHPAVTYKSLNYNAFIAILLQGTKEQSIKTESLSEELFTEKTKTNKQDSIISSLQNQMNALASTINSCCNDHHDNGNHNGHREANSNLTNVELNDSQTIVLEQNVPNPFAEQTTINYSLPDNTIKAQMLFYNAQGKLIKSTELTQKGKGTLNVFASDLSSGIYTYTLVVDGKIIETKKMVKQ